MAKVMFYGTGRRKNAIARVFLVPGEGRVIINNKPISEYFGRKTLEMIVRQPMELTGAASRFDVQAKVLGGGVSVRVGPIKLGIARALVQAHPNLRHSIKRAGFPTRDPRMKERRNYGLMKARKASQFSKR